MCMAALALVGAVVQGIGAKRAADQEAANYETQAKVQERNAAIAVTTGAYKADRKREDLERKLASQRAAYAGSGVALSGTAAEVIEDSATEGELDIQAIRWSTGMESDSQHMSAKTSRTNASNAKSAGNLAFITPVIGGVAKFGQSFGY